jgi:transposase
LKEPDEALGRSRGGLSTKAHLVCDDRGRPLSVLLTPVQRHGSTQLGALLDASRVPRIGRGRPRKRPERLIADKGYDFSTCRGLLTRRGIAHVIPRRPEREGHYAGRVGRRTIFDRETYVRRNVVERCVNRLKQWRGIATRYEKRAANYRAMLVIASLMMWLPS